MLSVISHITVNVGYPSPKVLEQWILFFDADDFATDPIHQSRASSNSCLKSIQDSKIGRLEKYTKQYFKSSKVRMFNSIHESNASNLFYGIRGH
jgi:hypothetical protein